MLTDCSHQPAGAMASTKRTGPVRPLTSNVPSSSTKARPYSRPASWNACSTYCPGGTSENSNSPSNPIGADRGGVIVAPERPLTVNDTGQLTGSPDESSADPRTRKVGAAANVMSV